MSTFLEVKSGQGVVRVFGDMRLANLTRITSALYREGVIARYPDITIDLESVSSFMTNVIPPLASYLRYLTQQHKIDYTLIQPRDNSTRNKMLKMGFFHYVDFRRFEKPKLKSSDTALMQFITNDECDTVRDKIVNSVLRRVSLKRQHITALEWAVSEITDNVINHSKSPVGGFATYSILPNSNIVEFTVADCGVGVAQTLGLKDEREAVEQAIREGVTRNKQTNQGNGLYGTYKLACASRGIFMLKSRHGNLWVNINGETHTKLEPVPYHGTIVNCQIDCDEPELIERAFVFSGRAHVPAYDYVERMHEGEHSDITINAFDICKTFGSRESGREARQYIENMIGSLEGNSVKISFKDVSVISSSFADEVFGKMFLRLGAMRFMRVIKIIDASSVVEALIDRAIQLRSQTGLSE